MTINLYNNKKDNIYAQKELESLGSITGTLRDESSVEDPVLLIELTSEQLSKCNYLYIEELGRYYYVTNKNVFNNTLTRLYCHVDVLMSFYEDIKKSKGISINSEDSRQYYLQGDNVLYSNCHVQEMAFPNGFDPNTDSYILMTI